MRNCNQGPIRRQVSFLRRQFLQDGDLPFTSVLSETAIAPALEAIVNCWNDRIYTPLMTLWVFLGQVLSADHSCRAAVARLIAHRLSRGKKACSSKTGAYCQARRRLPEKFFSAVTCLTGRALDSQADLYRQRWNNELDLRSIKSTMQMDVLRCKTPELVRKEVWTHILAYNLIRTIMAQAAAHHEIEPRTISFKGAIQTLEAFQPLIDFQGHRGSSFRLTLHEQLLDSIALHRVGNRPDRFEPRYRKRRAPLYGNLSMPRNEAKHAMLKGRMKI